MKTIDLESPAYGGLTNIESLTVEQTDVVATPPQTPSQQVLDLLSSMGKLERDDLLREAMTKWKPGDDRAIGASIREMVKRQKRVIIEPLLDRVVVSVAYQRTEADDTAALDSAISGAMLKLS